MPPPKIAARRDSQFEWVICATTEVKVVNNILFFYIVDDVVAAF